jgi:dihydrofolate synthase/folylpolyglutamate synthase
LGFGNWNIPELVEPHPKFQILNPPYNLLVADSHEVTDYDSALGFLLRRINYEQTSQIPYRSRSFKLQRMERLLAEIGNPHHQLKAIHIAGTKGKGSTAAMIDAVLRAAEFRTGLYTSPHLERIEERFVVDGRPCEASTFVELVRRLQPVVERFDAECGGTEDSTPATYFEITTAMAMLLFAQQEVDFAVLEVGLGGRLDSTNVCRPLVCVITSISYDHTQQLGSTLAQIASEKVGIVKPGVPVVSGVIGDEAQRVIAATARECGCKLLQLGVDFGFHYHAPRIGASASQQLLGAAFDFRLPHGGERAQRRDLHLAMCGRHQVQNAAVALAALDELAAQSLVIPEQAMRDGLALAQCGARIELVGQQPTVLLDAAHNVASAAALADVIREHFAGCPQRTLVLATSRDKDARSILAALLPEFDRVIFTSFQNNPRAADPQELLALAETLLAEQQQHRARTTSCTVNPIAEDALAQARRQTSQRGLICIAGSFFLAAQLRPLLRLK